MYKYGNLILDFEWDFAKEIKNIDKHGINFFEAIETFSDPNGILLHDPKHSEIEERHLWIGKNKKGDILTTRFTKRGNKIRIIGCANWRKLKRFYNEKAKN